ncbi:MAG: hypothetical protein GY928_36445 [Colwellia sp.]|nr:hypothetical protein [Colwellia sp.]
MPVKGIANVNRRLDNLANEVIPKVSEKALYIAGTVGAGYASLMTPIDTSLLVNSQYIVSGQEGDRAFANIGYSASYAAAVHGKKGTLKGKPRANGNGTYWQPSGEPQFLTKGFKENQREIFQAFKRAMKL